MRLPVQAFAGIVTVSVGHCHPRVVAAIDAQNHRLQHTTSIYLNNQIAEYAQELTARLPGDLKARPEKATLCGVADMVTCSASLACRALIRVAFSHAGVACPPCDLHSYWARVAEPRKFFPCDTASNLPPCRAHCRCCVAQSHPRDTMCRRERAGSMWGRSAARHTGGLLLEHRQPGH